VRGTGRTTFCVGYSKCLVYAETQHSATDLSFSLASFSLLRWYSSGDTAFTSCISTFLSVNTLKCANFGTGTLNVKYLYYITMKYK
jgi:hypothetical protein